MDEIEAYKSLIAEVINQALKDSMVAPHTTKYGIQAYGHAITAMQFLYSDDVNVWLQWLDIDGDAFKQRLDKIMFSDTSCNFVAGARSPLEIDDNKRRAFRANHKLWKKRKARHALGLDLEYEDE